MQISNAFLIIMTGNSNAGTQVLIFTGVYGRAKREARARNVAKSHSGRLLKERGPLERKLSRGVLKASKVADDNPNRGMGPETWKQCGSQQHQCFRRPKRSSGLFKEQHRRCRTSMRH